MFSLPASVRVVLATEPVDMRKSIDCLMAMLLDGIDVAEVRSQPAWTPPGRTGT
ncbi:MULTISPECIES: hypothetical protein [Myxococcus]|uniref:hypothetical protein n=1 Tax=Myxococcus TaxID=32 RepID=UPI0003487D7C|nr:MULTISPECIES: hypothetical protein [Myxococcus]NOJ53404.1 hypothetical protein [Myxococcus xanthus]QPM78990.1 hypothetical protein I5Q59_32880 [Myxococcus xanthus]QVW68067.1 hypothetical protein JTM82_00410 [Myxococcus xanthus DZ2]UEO05819.1 transposase [Myxococcus xanthus DZ2]UYI13935.1 transposase [Myxococcus xanthus]